MQLQALEEISRAGWGNKHEHQKARSQVRNTNEILFRMFKYSILGEVIHFWKDKIFRFNYFFLVWLK